MANALTYIKNVGKSISYASIDVLKELNPAVAEFGETNADLVKDVYASVKKLKGRSKDIPTKVMESQYGQFAKAWHDNLIEDVKSGKFYNKERKDDFELDGAKNMLGLDDDDSFNFDDDFGDDDDWSGGMDASTDEMMDLVGEKASTAVSTTIARASEYIMQGTGEIAKSQYAQLNAIYGGIHAGMGTINKNISSLVTFASESATTHFNNSKTFYESVNAADTERNRLLTDILENVKALKDAEKEKSYSQPTGTYSDIATYDGIPDLEKYFENIKKNTKNKVGFLTDALEMLTSTGTLMQFAASPLEGVTKSLVKTVIPKMLENSMEEFNKTLNGLFGTVMMKLSEKARDSEIWDNINDIFGIRSELKNNIDTSKYEKGKVPFDGVTRKSIVEVIPTYLSKIYSAVSGKPQDRYDYEKGKFVTVDNLKKEFDSLLKNNANYAASELDDIIREGKSKINFKSTDMENAFDKDWESMKEYMFRNRRVMNTRKKYKGSDFGLKGGMASDLNVELIRQLLDGSSSMFGYAGRIYQNRDDHTRQMREREEKGDSIYAVLQNGSLPESKDDKKSSGNKSPIRGIDNGIINELKSIHKEISYIRTYGIGGGRKGSAKGRRVKISNAPSFDDFDAFANTTTKTSTKKDDDIKYDTISDLTKENISDKAKSLINSVKDDEEKSKDKSSFSQQMTEAEGLSAKMAVIVNNAKELAQKPGKFIAAVFDKADERMYDLIYGPKEDKTGNKSLVGRMFNDLDKMFNKFSKFIDDTIINPLKSRINKDIIHDYVKRFFNIFGIDIDEKVKNVRNKLFGEKDENGDYIRRGILSGVRDEATKAKEWYKMSFSDVRDWFKTQAHKDYDSDKSDEKKYNKEADEYDEKSKFYKDQESTAGDEFREKARESNDRASTLAKDLKDFVANVTKTNGEDIPEAATGMRRASKTGLAVISEGEMVVPPDMNPFNISKRKRAEKKVKDDISRYGVDTDDIASFAEGTPYANFGEDEESLANYLRELGFEDNIIKSIIRRIRKKYTNPANEAKRKSEKYSKQADQAEADYRSKSEKYAEKSKNARKNAEDAKSRKSKSGYKTYKERVLDDLQSGYEFIKKQAKNVQEQASDVFGTKEENEKDTKELKSRASRILDDAKKSIPSIATGASIGAGLSLITGFVGGPLVGAAVGSAVGLAKNSQDFQEVLFGTPDVNGDYSGGKLPKQLANAIKKYMPDMSKGAAVGGFLTSLPFIPGGPITGILAGSALGFAKNNQDVQNALFGEGKLFKSKEEFKKKIESVAPKMGIGAGIGLLAGPFGLTTNVLLGSALGFASDTDKFKDVMFGPKDDKGNRTGGVFGAVTKPTMQFFKDMYSDFKGYMKDKVFEPLKEAFEPLNQQFRLMVDSITGFFKDQIKYKVGQPLDRMMKRLTERVFGFTKSILKFATAPARFALQVPIQAIRRAGDAARVHQVKKGGTGRTMSAAARNAFRNKKQFKMGPRDLFKDFDESLANMDYDQISSLESIFGGINATRNSVTKERNAAYNNIRKAVWNDADPKSTLVGKEIMSLIKKGYYEDALKYLDKVGTDPSLGGLTQEQKDKLRKEISTQAAKMKNADMYEADRHGTLDSLYSQLSGLGMNMDRKLFDKIANSTHRSNSILEMLGYEKELRGGSLHGGPGSTTNDKFQGSPVGELNEQEAQRHKDVMKSMNNIVTLLEHLAKFKVTDIEKDNADFIKDQEDRFNFVGSNGEDGEENPELAQEPGRKISSRIGSRQRRIRSNAWKWGKKSVKFGYDTLDLGIENAKFLYNITRDTDKVSNIIGFKHDNRYKQPDLQDSKWTGEENEQPTKPNHVKAFKDKVFAYGDKYLDPLFDRVDRMIDGIKIIAGSSIASATDNGMDIDTNSNTFKTGSVLDYAKRLKDKIKSKPKYSTQYVDGHPIKIFKDKNGDENVDPSSAETKDSLKYIEERDNTQRGILEGLKSLPSTISGLIGKSGDKEEKKSWFSSIFDKVKTGLKVAAIAAGVGLLGSFLTKKDENGNSIGSVITTAISDFFEQKIKPYLSSSWDGQQDGFGRFIYFFNPDNENGLFAKVRNFFTEYFPGICKTAAGLISSGVNWALKNVLPGAVKTIITNMPVILGGVISGTVQGINSLLHGGKSNDGLYNATDQQVTLSTAFAQNSKTDMPAWMKDVSDAVEDSSDYDWDSMTVGNGISNKYKEASNLQDYLGNKSEETGESTGHILKDIIDASGRDTGTKTNSGQSVYEVQGVQVTQNDPLNGRLPKAFNYLPEAYKSKAKVEYDKVKYNVMKPYGYGTMTVGEILDSDHIVLGYLEDGTRITGAHALEYSEIASQLGINFKLTDEEIKQNTKNEGTHGTTIQSLGIKAGVQSFVRGVAGTSFGVGTAGKVVEKTSKGVGAILSKIPGVGKIAGKVVDTTGEVGSSLLNKINKAGNVVGSVFDRRTIQEIAKDKGNDVFDFVTNGAKEATESASDNIVSFADHVSKKNGVKTVAKNLSEKVAKEATEETAENLFENGVKAGTGAFEKSAKKQKGKLITKFAELIKKGASKLLQNKFVKNKFTEAMMSAGKVAVGSIDKILATIGEKLGTKLAELFIKYGGKLGAKAAARIGAYTASGFAIMVGQAVASFISGWNNANSIVGTVDQPDGFTRFLCALANSANETFLLGLVPLKLVVDLVFTIGQDCLGMDFGELSKKREESQKIVDEYNEQKGTELSIEEYNNKDKISTKVKNKVKSVWNTAKEKASNIKGTVADGVSAAVKYTKEKITKSSTFDILKYTKNVVSDTWAEYISGKDIKSKDLVIADDDPNKDVKKIIYDTVKIISLIPGGIVKLGNFVYNKGIKPFASAVAAVGSGIGETAGDLIKHAWNGEFIDMITDNSGDAQTEVPAVDFISKALNGVTKFELAIPSLIALGAGFVVRQFEKTIDELKTIGSSLGDVIGNVMKKATSGSNPLPEIFSTKGYAKTGNLLVDGVSAVVNTAVKFPLTPIALITTAISFAKNKIDEFIKPLMEAGTLSDTDKSIIDKSNNGDINPFSKKYWKVNSKLSGAAYGFNMFLSVMKKLFNLPSAIVAYFNPAKIVRKGLDKITKALDIDDSETKSTKSSSSSKTKSGKGSGIWGRGTSDNDIRNEAKRSQEREITDTTKTSDNTFVSQLDSKYANQKFNITGDTTPQTIADSGCAPAAATMAVNGTLGDKQLSMNKASDLALKYKVQNDGVNATYFGEEFARNGMNAQYITSENPNERKYEVAQQLANHNRVVLMGSDQTNTSKKDSPYGPNPHYVVANSMSPDGKYIYINDPESNKPNIKYKADKVLNNSSLGIAAATAKGSKVRNVLSKVRRFTGRGTLPGGSVAEQCWNYLRSNGFSEEATAGMMGNFRRESGMNPAQLQIGGPAAGLYQMETYGDYSSRWGNMARYAEAKGRDWTDLESQLEYLIQEMPSQFDAYTGHGVYTYPNGGQAWWPEKMTVESFKKINDIAKATEIFERVFERGSVTVMDLRIQYAKEYYTQFTGKYVDVGTGDSTSSDSSSDSSSGTWVDDLYGVFNGLAEAYGLKTSSSSSSSDSDSSSTGGAVGGNDKQKALVNQMKSVEGKLRYSQQQRDPETGSGDCSSTVQWAYEKVLGVDPGNWTGAMETDPDTYTVTTNFDESKMEPGDEILYDGHVEMYMGDGKMIGHGGGADGNEMGPTVKPLSDQGRFRMIRRWVGFKNGSGSGLVGRGSGNNRLRYPKGPTVNTRAYSKAENIIRGNGFNSLLPVGYDENEISKDDIQLAQVGNNGNISDITPRNKNNKPIFVAKGTTASDTSDIAKYLFSSAYTKIQNSADTSNNDIVYLVKTIIQLLTSVVQNTEQLNNIFKLLSDYTTTAIENPKSQKALVAKQNLINAMQGSGDKPNEQLMRLIENAEKIANQ